MKYLNYLKLVLIIYLICFNYKKIFLNQFKVIVGKKMTVEKNYNQVFLKKKI